MWVRIFAEEFYTSGLTWLSFMKKKEELSWKSYLEAWNPWLFINFWLVKTSNGFFYIYFHQTLQYFAIKKSLFFFEIVLWTAQDNSQRSRRRRVRARPSESAARRELDDWSHKETKTFQNHQMISIETISFLVSH